MALADAAVGIDGAIQRQLHQRMLQMQFEAQQQEAARKAQLEARSADRADAGLSLQYDQMDAQNARNARLDASTAENQAFTQAGALAEQIPPETFLPDSDPAAGLLQRGGRGSLLTRQAPTVPMGEDFTGPMPNAETPQQAQVGRPGGFLKTMSQRQGVDEQTRQDKLADNERAAQIAAAGQARQGTVDARAQAQADEAARHNRVMENKPTGSNSADDLKTFEEKEKIKAKYAGSRPSLGAERQTLAYYNRAKQASDEIAPLEDAIAAKGLAGQAQLQYAPNMFQSDTNQSYRQAQRAFTEARLRKESGAAIPVAEYENDAKTYFAQPGDKPAVLEQKRRGRAVVLDGLKNAAGKAYEEFYGQSGAGGGHPSGAPVAMRAPDGRRLSVPADKVAEMEAHGAKRE